MALKNTLLNKAVETGSLSYDDAKRLRDSFTYICDIWSSQVSDKGSYHSHMTFWISCCHGAAAFSTDPRLPSPLESPLETLEITP